MHDRDAWDRLTEALDAEVDARVRAADARRKMKLSILSFVVGGVMLAVDALAFRQVVAAQQPTETLLHWWPVVLTCGVMLMAFATLRTGYTAFKASTEAELAKRVTTTTFEQFELRMSERHQETQSRMGELRDAVDNLRDIILKRSA